MPVKVRLALESLAAWRVTHDGGARVRVLAVRIVCLHVGLPVVATLEELATDSALVSGLLGSGPLPLLLESADAGEDRLHIVLRHCYRLNGVHLGHV